MVKPEKDTEFLQHQLDTCQKVNADLFRQNEQIKAAVHQVPVGVIISRGSGSIVQMINPEMEKLIGLPGHLFIGKNFIREFSARGGQISYPNNQKSHVESFSQHFLSKKHFIAKDFEFLITKPSGEEVFVSMSSSPVVGESKDDETIISIFSDITNRKKEEAFYKNAKKRLEREVEEKTRILRETNWQLTTIFNASSESLWVCDGKGIVLSINKATENLLGIRPEEVVGKDINELVDEGFMDVSVTGRVLQTGEQTSIIQNAIKTKKRLLVTGTPVFDDDGQILLVIVNERDLTKLNRLQKELQKVKEETNRFREELTELHLQELVNQEIIAYSQQMQDILAMSRKLARMDISNILILGESGTGKSLLAKYIHSIAKNFNGPFVRINCAALPGELLEAELFGYEKGAFTGARDQGKIGLFEMANDGTLFLDEIGELPLPLQAKLLHCLEENEIMHLGGLRPIKINCTVIAATNVDLAQAVEERIFRKDLYFRLNVFPVTIPPLRERVEDIWQLSLHFLKKYNEKYNANRQISSRELEKIQKYSFPGNVRELENIIKKMIVLADANLLDFLTDEGEDVTSGEVEHTPLVKGQGLKQAMVEYEITILETALETFASTRALANHLQISQSQVVRKLTEHGLSDRLKRKRATSG